MAVKFGVRYAYMRRRAFNTYRIWIGKPEGRRRLELYNCKPSAASCISYNKLPKTNG